MAGVNKTVSVPAGYLPGLLLCALQPCDRIDRTIRQA